MLLVLLRGAVPGGTVAGLLSEAVAARAAHLYAIRKYCIGINDPAACPLGTVLLCPSRLTCRNMSGCVDARLRVRGARAWTRSVSSTSRSVRWRWRSRHRAGRGGGGHAAVGRPGSLPVPRPASRRSRHDHHGAEGPDDDRGRERIEPGYGRGPARDAPGARAPVGTGSTSFPSWSKWSVEKCPWSGRARRIRSSSTGPTHCTGASSRRGQASPGLPSSRSTTKPASRGPRRRAALPRRDPPGEASGWTPSTWTAGRRLWTSRSSFGPFVPSWADRYFVRATLAMISASRSRMAPRS